MLRVSPLICAAFGADFDGDEMTLHRPLAQEALKEASELMTPRWNLISIANGRPVCNFDQDFVLGTFLLYQPSLGFRDEFLKLLPQELHASVPSGVCYEKSVGMDLIKELCQRFPEEAEAVVGEWARLAFRACTELGVSFSFTELQDLARQTTGSAAGLSPEQLAKEHLRRIIESDSAVSKSGYHFAAMSQSGARGRKQVPQILVSRGHLSPGRLPYRTSVEDMTFSESLLDGFDLSTFWRTGLNARSSMCDKNLGTAGGGYLTRRLVFACSGVRIASDCLTGTRDGVLGCQTPGGVCGACFGSSPDGRSLSPGFPIGLVTAQSIGERGTQLSMQSFHTGQKVASIAEVEALLDDHAYLFECTVTGCEKMVIMRRADCTELPLDSSGLPVCPDHAGPMRRIECDNLFGSQAAGHFVRAMRSLDAYRSLDQRYIQLLWKILAARGGGLRRALDALKGSGAELGFERQLEHMAGLAARNASVGLQHLLDRLLFTTGSGGWGGAAMEEET